MPGSFQNLGAVYPVGARALWTEFGKKILKGNSQGNGLKTQMKNALAGVFIA